MADLSGVPNLDVVPIGRYYSVVIVYGRHADAEDNVVRPLGSGPINNDLSHKQVRSTFIQRNTT